MLRLLMLLLILFLPFQASAQEWLYAKVWVDKSTHELARMKLVPADGGDPFFVVSRQNDFPDQQSWEWMSDEGGVLRLFSTDSTRHDSALLISGQTRRTVFRKQDAWLIPNGNQPLLLRTLENSETWLLEVILEPIEGVQSVPEPILILSLEPHPKKKNRFLIESTGNLQSIPVVLMELGITLALIAIYQ